MRRSRCRLGALWGISSATKHKQDVASNVEREPNEVNIFMSMTFRHARRPLRCDDPTGPAGRTWAVCCRKQGGVGAVLSPVCASSVASKTYSSPPARVLLQTELSRTDGRLSDAAFPSLMTLFMTLTTVLMNL